MRSFSLLLLTSTMLAAPVAADALRDSASEFFGPLPAAVTELEGNSVTPERIELGKTLFFDVRLSSSGTMSCVSCHDLAAGGDDGLPTPVGQDGKAGLRNTSSILNTVLNESHFWDGREADLAAQTAGPEAAGLAMLNTPEAQLAALQAIPTYAEGFAAAFPGEADPLTMTNAALALEAFEATLLTPAPFDAWLAGDDAALTDAEKAGLQQFLDKGCAFCHYGQNLGGAGYYPLGLVEKPGIDVQSADEAEMYALSETDAEEFVFRTAPLRNIALTAPYFHSGKVSDLAVAVDIMAAGQLGSPLLPEETAAIVVFLQSLTGAPPAVTPPAP